LSEQRRELVGDECGPKKNGSRRDSKEDEPDRLRKTKPDRDEPDRLRDE